MLEALRPLRMCAADMRMLPYLPATTKAVPKCLVGCSLLESNRAQRRVRHRIAWPNVRSCRDLSSIELSHAIILTLAAANCASNKVISADFT